MNKNLKLGLIIAASVFIGLFSFRLLQGYIVMKQVENITTNLTNNIEKSSEQSRQRMLATQQEQQRIRQAQIAETNRVRALKTQQDLEKNLLCAKNTDTGKCSCYDKRSGIAVNMSLEQCNHYVDQQF